jgi:hypothetical protein
MNVRVSELNRAQEQGYSGPPQGTRGCLKRKERADRGSNPGCVTQPVSGGIISPSRVMVVFVAKLFVQREAVAQQCFKSKQHRRNP